MLTLRQMEAVVWIAQLGTFERAAARLGTSQSAISKRINELEEQIGFPLFDRSQRGSKFTPRGEEVLEIARKMVLLQDEIATIKAGSRAKIRQQVRIGVTELTAMTWLPRLISELHDRHPGAYVDLEVENGRTLYERLQSGHLDIIICPEFASDANLTAIHLESVEMKWMMQPGFIGKDHILSLHDLVSYPLVLQGGRSGAGSHLSRWLLSERLVFDRVLFTDSLMAVVGLTVAGLGVSHLPHRCFDYLIASKRIEIINTEPNPPDIAYVAIFRQGGPSHFMNKLAELMRELCDFSTII